MVSQVIEHVGIGVLVLVSVKPDNVVDEVCTLIVSIFSWSEGLLGIFSPNVVHDEVRQVGVVVFQLIDPADGSDNESAVVWRVSVEVCYVRESSFRRSVLVYSGHPAVWLRLCFAVP